MADILQMFGQQIVNNFQFHYWNLLPKQIWLGVILQRIRTFVQSFL